MSMTVAKAQVFKLVGNPIESFEQIAKKYGTKVKIQNPDIKSFDYVAGISPKNGKFDIFTFRDTNGLILQREFQLGNRSFQRNYKHSKTNMGNCCLNITEFDYNNINNFKITNFIKKGISYIREEYFYTGSGATTMSLAKLKSKNPKREITMKTSWDGNIPEIKYENTIGRLPNRDLELLPVVMEPELYKSKVINHIACIFEKKYGLNGIVQKPKMYDSADKDDVTGFCSFLGHIKINSECLWGSCSSILGILAHEYRHAKDFSDVMRLKSTIDKNYKYIREKNYYSSDDLKFIKKSMAKGRIRDNSKFGQILKIIINEQENYSELCKKIGHDNLLMEKRAIDAEIDAIYRARDVLKEAMAIIGM